MHAVQLFYLYKCFFFFALRCRVHVFVMKPNKWTMMLFIESASHVLFRKRTSVTWSFTFAFTSQEGLVALHKIRKARFRSSVCLKFIQTAKKLMCVLIFNLSKYVVYNQDF